MALKVTVDMDVCESHGQCVFTAPTVFAMGEDGRLVVITDAPEESLRLRVEDAADVCPVQAIRLEG